MTTLTELGFVHGTHIAGGLVAQRTVSPGRSATGPPTGVFRRARHVLQPDGNVFASRCLHAGEVSLSTMCYEQHHHLRFTATLDVSHLNPADQVSVALVFDFR